MAEEQSLETLLAYMKSPIADTRQDAARKLGERRTRNQLAVEALSIAARKDEDYKVRKEAVRSLGMIKDFAALPEMLDTLQKDDTAEVRSEAARALVALYTEHNIDFIVNRRVGWSRLNPFLDTNDSEIIEPYQVVDPSIIQALGQSARDDDYLEVRIASTRALGVLRGRDALPYLNEALNADKNIRIDVIRAMIKIGDPEAGKYMVPFFRNSDRKVRNQAMVAAGLLKYKPAVAPLLDIYGIGQEDESRFRKVTRKVKNPFEYSPMRDEAALWALSILGDEKAEQVFVENVGDKDPERRRYAVEGLARIGDPRYMDQFSRLVLTEEDADTKLALHWAIYKLGSRPDIQYVVRKLDTGQAEQAREYLLEVNSPDDLLPYIKASNKKVRREVIDILGQIGDRETINDLEPIAQSSGAETADAATLAIKRIEWRISGKPQVDDDPLRRGTRPRRNTK
jgi:HEAT repeat protein